MQRTKYAPEFKDEAVKQVIAKGHSVVDVAKRLGVSENVLYHWVSKFKEADEPTSLELKAMQAGLLLVQRQSTKPEYEPSGQLLG